MQRFDVECDKCGRPIVVWALNPQKANAGLRDIDWDADEDTHICPECKDEE